MKSMFVVILMMMLTGSGVWSKPILEISSKLHDFGMLPKNSVLFHVFQLKSTGTDTVRIDEIKTGCACAISKMKQDWIAPGDSLDMEISWNIHGFRSSLFRSIRIFYNGNPDPVRVSLKGMVVEHPDSLRPLSISPYRFELASTPLKNIDSVAFKITNYDDHDLKLQSTSPKLEQCVLVLPSTVPAKSSATGYIRLNPEYDSLEFETSVTIVADDFKHTKLTVPIRRKFYR